MKKQTKKPRKAGKAIPKKRRGLKEALDQGYPKYGCASLFTNELRNNIKNSFSEKIKIPELQPTTFEDLNFSVNPDQRYIFYHHQTGCRTAMTGRELLQAFRYKDEIESLHKKLSEQAAKISETQPPIPSIPSFDEAERIEYCKQFNRALEKANEIVSKERQTLKPQYAHEVAYFNGMELILSIFEKREPKFESRAFEDERSKSPAEIVEQFIAEVNKHLGLSDYPIIQNDINHWIVNRMKKEAEMASEALAIARKRFEECLESAPNLKMKSNQ